MDFFRALLLIVLAVAASGCGDEKYRDLKRHWSEAEDTGTQKAYIAYMAKQGFAEHLAHPVEQRDLFREYFDRRNEARSRIFEIGLQTARGTCPFSKLYVDLRQNIHGVKNGRAKLARWYKSPMSHLGVEFVDDESQADASLVFELTGRAVSQGYSADANPANVRYYQTGGSVRGSLSVKGHSENPIVFEGHAKPANYVFADTNRTGQNSTSSGASVPGVPSGIMTALSNADFRNKISELFYDVCGPEAGVYLSFFDNIRIDAAKRVPQSTLDFRKRMIADIDQTSAMLHAAAIGVPNKRYIYDGSVDAFDLLIEHAKAEDRATLWRAARGHKRLPPWSEERPKSEAHSGE